MYPVVLQTFDRAGSLIDDVGAKDQLPDAKCLVLSLDYGLIYTRLGDEQVTFTVALVIFHNRT